MTNPFITNDPSVKSFRWNIPGVCEVAFCAGILDPERYGGQADAVRAALMERMTWPIYGVHYHLRDGSESTPPMGEPASPIRVGARSSRSFKDS